MNPEWQVCPYCPSGDPTRLPAPSGSVPELAPTMRVPAPAGWRPAPLPPTVRLSSSDPDPETPPSRGTVLLRRPHPALGIAWLVGTAGPVRGAMHRLEGERMTVGAARACDAVVDHPHVSEHHASLRCRGREFLLTDLDSSNGTFVNGTRVTQQVLSDGDRVRLGSTEWIFKCVFFDESE